MSLDSLVPLAVPVVLLAAGLYFFKVRPGGTGTGQGAGDASAIPETWVDPLRPLARRRAAVVLWSALVVVAVWSVWSGSAVGTLPAFAAFGVGIALSHATRAMAEQPSSLLDERMVASRNQAFRSAYYLLGGSIALGLICGAIAHGIVWDEAVLTLDRDVVNAAAMLAIVTVAHLPSVILAWTEKVV